MNFSTQCGENRHTDVANFATLIHTKKINTLCGDFRNQRRLSSAVPKYIDSRSLERDPLVKSVLHSRKHFYKIVCIH